MKASTIRLAVMMTVAALVLPATVSAQSGRTGSNYSRSGSSSRPSATTSRSGSSSRPSATTSRSGSSSKSSATTSRSGSSGTSSSVTSVRRTQTNTRSNEMKTPRAGYPGYDNADHRDRPSGAVQYNNRPMEHHQYGWARPPMKPQYRPRPPYHGGDHFFGFRIDILPRGYTMVRVHGVEYFYFNNIYYRRQAGHYIISRPPVGVHYHASLFDLALTAITINAIHDIAERAREAARLAAFYAELNREYKLRTAEQIALTMAYADTQYYYDDGVFYTIRNGEYYVIDAPVGALVTTLPYDYEEVELGGEMYYLVDSTLYKVAVIDGALYFEVVCQL